ncbi:uncharacterized protein LOC122023329 [Zingiber officinale]|uniref:uncharacterized protein LOC122023329 n=1 Tax=Zingiber officinale TaxID=94328 RepID=UPI001C4B6A08|nr:uncharacterized protein LOC122023329 [Zingiber officinale]
MEYATFRDLEGDHFAFGSHFDSPKSISAAPRPLPALSPCNGSCGGDDDGEEEEEVYIDADFQFDLLLTDLEDDGRLIPADKIFFQGRIRPLYPSFDDDDEDDDAASNEEEVNGSPVEADGALRQGFKGIPPESYCIRPPRSEKLVHGQHKKWPSMGFLHRWQLGDLIFKRHRNDRKEKQELAAVAAAPHEAVKKAGKKKKAVDKTKDKKRRP